MKRRLAIALFSLLSRIIGSLTRDRYTSLYAALIVHDPRGIRITDVHVADTTHIPESVVVDLTAMIARMDTGRPPLVPDTADTDTVN